MITIENVEIAGWEPAIRVLHSSNNSQEESDSERKYESWHDMSGGYFDIGPNDLNLITSLRNSDTGHWEFMQMITVYLDITAPSYWWKEFDTYKVGTVSNSCSTMHKIVDKEFTLEDFSTDKIVDAGEPEYKDMYDDLVLTLQFDCETQWYDPHDIFRKNSQKKSGGVLTRALSFYIPY